MKIAIQRTDEIGASPTGDDAEKKRAAGLTPAERAEEGARAKENLLRILEKGYEVGPFTIKFPRKDILPVLANAEIYIRRQAERGALQAVPTIEAKVKQAASKAVKPIVVAGVIGSAVLAGLITAAGRKRGR